MHLRLVPLALLFGLLAARPEPRRVEPARPQLIPAPRQLQALPGTWAVPLHARVCWTGLAAKGDATGRARVEAALKRFVRASREEGEPTLEANCNEPDLVLHWEQAAAGLPALGDDERYTLHVNDAGARLNARHSTGILRALETLTALSTKHVLWGALVSAVHVEDAPRFAWRGLMLDAARNFLPVPVVLRTLDAMAAAKLNVLHWHLTDDQGFRIESRTLPRLHEVGSNGQYYRQSEVRTVVAHAAALGIRVVPEFDVPGHTASWLVAYPELASGVAPAGVPSRWGILSDVMDPTSEGTYRLLDTFFGEMAGLFGDAYVHVGGDEVVTSDWSNNAAIQARREALGIDAEGSLHDYFVHRVADVLARRGKHVVGWDEILAPALPAGTVVQSWSGASAMQKASKLGQQAILSFGFYLNGSASLSDMYGNAEGLVGTDADAKAAVLGGEACVWTELLHADNVERAIWPRAAAVAERLWSGAQQTDVDDFLRRLPDFERRLAALGIDAAASRHGQIATLASGEAAHALEGLMPYFEAIAGNWWPGFGSRRSELALLDLTSPSEVSADRLWRLALANDGAQPHFAGRHARRALAERAGLAAAAADAVLAVDAGAPVAPGLWPRAREAAAALKVQAQLLEACSQADLPGSAHGSSAAPDRQSVASAQAAVAILRAVGLQSTLQRVLSERCGLPTEAPKKDG